LPRDTLDREAVQGPESSDREDCGSLPGEIGASGRDFVPSLVVKENLALPVVRLNAEDLKPSHFSGLDRGLESFQSVPDFLNLFGDLLKRLGQS
jgi:hypothetical protein